MERADKGRIWVREAAFAQAQHYFGERSVPIEEIIEVARQIEAYLLGIEEHGSA